jgi:glyoxylase-like metal-dependent hydrolase (beta-lactamase superfamily II)/ferredoxin
MARWDERLPENAPGTFFVDRTCIDCDTCRQLAPTVFGRLARARQSVVHHQPQGEEELTRAAMALVSCPTASIGTASKVDLRAGSAALPEAVGEGVFYCGFTAEASYGAASYLVRRPEGNVLVDSPRAAEPLLRRLEALGGVRTLFLTHGDDVADHALLRERFGCERVMHAGDVDEGTRGVEVQLEGEAPVALAPDLLAIPVPGHTRGSMALLHRDTFLFTGDHLWGAADGAGLSASRAVCWYSWPQQVGSLERLLGHPFTWVLPGHGRRFHAPSAAAMHAHLRALLEQVRG